MTDQLPDLLKGLTPADAAGVMALGTRRQLAGGAVLFDIGTEATHLFFVERGCVNLTMPIQVGQRQEDVKVEQRGPGQMLGWSALIPPHRSRPSSSPCHVRCSSATSPPTLRSGTSSSRTWRPSSASDSRCCRPCGCARCSA